MRVYVDRLGPCALAVYQGGGSIEPSIWNFAQGRWDALLERRPTLEQLVQTVRAQPVGSLAGLRWADLPDEPLTPGTCVVLLGVDGTGLPQGSGSDLLDQQGIDTWTLSARLTFSR